jgi:hypothetical protein
MDRRGSLASALIVALLALLTLGVSVAGAQSRVLAWGSNSASQFGNNREDGFPTAAIPVPAATGLGDVQQLAAGKEHAIALLAGGTLATWGSNGFDQLGASPAEHGGALPGALKEPTGVKAVAAGEITSYALLENGTVEAWGAGGSGQLGTGAQPEKSLPVVISGLSGVKAIAAGRRHALALLENGTVVAWGCCEGVAGGKQLSPTAVPGLSGVQAIAGGGEDSYALLENGTVEAWGANESGQLGDGGETADEMPAPVSGLSHVKAIAAGTEHAIALLEDGTVEGWGSNNAGQLGLGNLEPKVKLPTAAVGLSGVTAIAAGGGGPFPNEGEFSLALREGGTVMGFGAPLVGGETRTDEPKPICGGTGATIVAGGENTAYAVAAPGEPLCVHAYLVKPPWGGPGATTQIHGTNLGEVTEVQFGTTPASGYTVESPMLARVTVPPGSGTVSITVKGPLNTSTTPNPAAFTYVEPPSFGRCLGASETPEFSDVGCTLTSGTLIQEWQPTTSGTFATASTTSTTLETVGGLKVTCLSESGSGGFTGTKSLGGFLIRYSGCERAGEKCSSSGEPAGVVASRTLEGVLGLSKLAKSGKPSENTPGIELRPTGGGAFAEFSCGAASIVLRGAVIAHPPANKTAKTLPIALTETRGKQNPSHLVGMAADPFEGSLNGGAYEAAGLRGHIVLNVRLEVNTVA